MDLEVRHLRLVTAVAEHGSLTKASEHLNLTQSALSHQLRELESRLGTPLFLRMNRRMALTPAGEYLLESAQSVLERLESTETAIREGTHGRTRQLRISTECYTCYHWLPALLREFRQRCPRVDVRIDPDATRRPLGALLDGKLDLAIMSSRVKDRRLVVRPLFEDELLVVVNPAHPLGRRPFVRAEDFASETVLVYGPKSENYALNRAVLARGVQPAAIEEVMLTEAIVEMVKAGLGISILARWAIQPYLSARTVRAVRLTRSGYRRQWSAAICRPLADLDYVQEFVRLVEAHAPTRSAVVPFIPPREASRSK
jgi:LysR family transcriptional regulator for metE and metH